MTAQVGHPLRTTDTSAHPKDASVSSLWVLGTEHQKTPRHGISQFCHSTTLHVGGDFLKTFRRFLDSFARHMP